MTLIVNLSTTHEYSIDETLSAFVKLCDEHSQGSMPGFFQSITNYAWVMWKYKTNYSTLIEPYKLGKISTDEFLENLSSIFDFMKEMDKQTRDSLLTYAWNASIKLSEKTSDRFSQLVQESKMQPVYLISNTNELNVKAILDLFKKNNPDFVFIEGADVSIKASEEPIEIFPNIYLCLSYRFGAFKEETTVSTMSLIESLSTHCPKPITLVSQYEGDVKKAQLLNFKSVLKDYDFYAPMVKQPTITSNNCNH